MRLESIKIRGVLRFEDEATLVLSDLPSGLIAFVGSNGEGKSTMLEAPIACLYREFPSREKAVLDYVHAADGFIETMLSLEGRGLYRARLSLDGPHRTSEGIITQINPDGSQVFMTANSKLTTYDAAIATLLPPLKILLCSVFAAQNRVGSFASLDKKGRKDLFASLFGLDHYQMLSDRARDAAGLVQTALGGVLLARQTLAGSLGDIDQGLPEMTRLVQEETAIMGRRTKLSDALEAATAALEVVATAAHRHVLTRQRRETLLAEGETLTRARAKLQTRAADVKAATERKAAAEKNSANADVAQFEHTIGDTREHGEAIRRIGEALAAIVKDADARIANNRTLIERATDIRKALKTVGELDRAITVCLDESVVEEINVARTHERDISEKVSKAGSAAKDLTRALADATLLETVPCGGVGDFASCQFLTNAAVARDRIPALHEEALKLDALNHALADVRMTITGLVERQRRNTDTVNGLRQDRDQQQKIADRLPALERAEEQIAGHEARKKDALADHDRRVAEARARQEDRDATVRQQIATRRSSERTRLDAITWEGTEAASEIVHDLAENGSKYEQTSRMLDAVNDDLNTTAGASDKAQRLHAALTDYRTEWDASTAFLATNKSQQEALAKEIAARAAKVLELEDLDAKVATLRQDQLEWQLFHKAFGRDGIPMLEIDAAGPTIASFTNDLIVACGLGRFAVDIVTQEVRASKSKSGETMKETMELQIIDSERAGGPRDLGDLSGGEQVIVDECLKSAIALVANARNEHKFRTAWRDETVGSLDSGRALQYMTMLRRVYELGEFHQILFVSHNDDASRLADAQVVFSGGRISIRLPPYE